MSEWLELRLGWRRSLALLSADLREVKSHLARVDRIGFWPLVVVAGGGLHMCETRKQLYLNKEEISCL